MRLALKLLVVAFIAVACGAAAVEPEGRLVAAEDFDTGYPPAPRVPAGDLDPAIDARLTDLLVGIIGGAFESEHLEAVVAGQDPRVTWALADLMRFISLGDPARQLEAAFAHLTGASVASETEVSFVTAFNHLIAWDLPAWSGYPDFKHDLYTIIEPGWAQFFEGDDRMDWRFVTWGGVGIDARPFGSTDGCPQGCIPALEDPTTVPASEGDWYPDESIVFGVEVNGEALALPKNQMETHEMMNLTLGDTRLGLPSGALCGSAQAYLTGDVPDGFETAVLRTSGLLSRSNKVMFELNTMSVFDTFTGEAMTGPLAEVGFKLEQVSVVTSTWGSWKEAHPDTRITARDGGIGRVYSADPLRGRDDAGPIFPIGSVDPRLPVQEPVIGAIDADGTAIAFPVASTRAALEAGKVVGAGELRVSLDGDGLLVSGPDGEVGSHEAFWFAWSQFHPETLVWEDTE
jgi:hypothetical protein